MKKIKLTLCLICFLSSQTINAQLVLTKLTSSDISGTICPVQDTAYEIKNLGDFGGCIIQWSTVNGSPAVWSVPQDHFKFHNGY